MLDPLVIEPMVLPVPTRSDVARRLARATGAATRYLVIARRQGKLDELAVAGVIRRTFEQLGGTLTKFGQLIASSPSIFGEEVAHEFRGCLDAGPPVPFPRVRRVVERDLGRPLEAVYGSFDPKPMAAASLAVVHRATLLDGTPVAVKVLRPGVAEQIATDLAVLRPLCNFLARQVAVGIAGTLAGLVHGLEVQIAEELDLTNEGRSLHWFRHALDLIGVDRLVVPRVFDEQCGPNVITMQLLDGVAIDDTDGIAAMGVDPTPLLHECIRVWFAATLCTGAFHGDVHAGNMLVRADGTMALLDWGIVGRLDASTSLFFRKMIEGALGDDDAWEAVAAHVKATYGVGMMDALGIADDQFTAFVRSQVEPLFHVPFAQLDLRTMLIGDGAVDGKRPGQRTRRESIANWRAERKRQHAVMNSKGYGSGFDQATFLLSKQLVYFERYGKLFLPDTQLLDDPAVFRALLDSPALR
ncbi:MAG TPA: AarF/ABC1/UbiB kinase family protein [Acidimicrobiales bacterium]|jgi:predicted unusual protein kinase regulating ubiquinone biosynthesis (AarF/ABC1/UbiB family)|nr:AarF/ABC1/UbiB kinase family protein [Acidimicrobiales bacterium]